MNNRIRSLSKFYEYEQEFIGSWLLLRKLTLVLPFFTTLGEAWKESLPMSFGFKYEQLITIEFMKQAEHVIMERSLKLRGRIDIIR